MNPWLAGHLILPLHERLMGRDTFAVYRQLQQSQWLSADELARLQLRKLQALVRLATAASLGPEADRLRERVAGVLLAAEQRDLPAARDLLARLADAPGLSPRLRARIAARLPRGQSPAK